MKKYAITVGGSEVRARGIDAQKINTVPAACNIVFIMDLMVKGITRSISAMSVEKRFII